MTFNPQQFIAAGMLQATEHLGDSAGHHSAKIPLVLQQMS